MNIDYEFYDFWHFKLGCRKGEEIGLSHWAEFRKWQDKNKIMQEHDEGVKNE